jgi:undecaprenyl-diphosphatase
MIEWLNVVLLGIIEGITEFLPISSTGHLIVASRFFPINENLKGVFEIFIQFGAVVAVLFYYRHQLVYHARTVTREQKTRTLWLGIIIAFIPAGVIGFLASDRISELLFRTEVVAGALIIGGILFLFAERTQLAAHNLPAGSIEDTPLTLRQALIVGLWQLLALIPGMSRSGMSIIGGIAAGVDRARATQFSFYLALPTLGGATLYTLLKNLNNISANDLGILFVGALVSGIVAWIAMRWLLNYVSRNSFVPFGWYRIAVGILIIVVEVAFQNGLLG